MGKILGASADLLRALLDREQDRAGSQLPRQVQCFVTIKFAIVHSVLPRGAWC